MNPARRARTTLAASCAIHFLQDGCSNLLYALFPIWERQFGLALSEIGSLRAAYSGALACFQIPAGFLAERWGEARVLLAGSLLTAAAFLCLGAAGGFAALVLLLLLGGLGAATQHPLASALVSRAYEQGPRRAAMGTYNFSGELGKAVLPALSALVIPWAGWQWAGRGTGLLLLATGIGVFLALKFAAVTPAGRAVRQEQAASNGWGIRSRRGFTLLAMIHSIDNGSRTVFLTYLPFLLAGKGLREELAGLAVGLTLAGGADLRPVLHDRHRLGRGGAARFRLSGRPDQLGRHAGRAGRGRAGHRAAGGILADFGGN